MTPTASADRARRGPAAAALAAALLAASVAGCGPDSKPVTSTADAADQAALNKSVAEPCNEPPGMNYPSANQPPVTPQPKYSDKATLTHKNGCAGLKFQLTPDGSVTNASIVTESPEGFGFGNTALMALKATQFPPGQPKSDYFYDLAVFVQTQTSAGPSRPSVK